MPLAPDETILTGQWITQDGRVVGDEACRRIHELTPHLEKLGTREGGWTTLYRDPTDGRYWEHTYPHGEWHGGGPPQLRYLSDGEAVELYGPL